MKFKALISIILFISMLLSCQFSKINSQHKTTGYFPVDMPDNLWVSQSVSENLDLILANNRLALKKLVEKDTLGAEIYFNQAFEILSQFSDEERTLLQTWPKYDSVFYAINLKYEEIYLNSNVPLEAEEIRHDIVEIEERSLADSALFSESTIIDTSGGIPITINHKVRLAIKYFQTKGRYVFTKWLERSGKYEDMAREIFRKTGVPEELIYVAMIESGFNPQARSYARAVGMWQFMSATGGYYGLRHNWWFDERRDAYKASLAAAQHLNDLHDRFGDWYLALAGYNFSPKKVERNMRNYNTRDYWKLHRLPRQTRNYVPTFLAATIIAQEPEKFGFFVEKQKPVKVDTVLISESVDLNVIANMVDTSYAYIRELNPAVLRWVTPPGIKDFSLYLPDGKKEKFNLAYAKIPDDEKRAWVRHKIKQGESLSTISQKYSSSISVIKSSNKLTGNFIRAGNYLLIPVPQNKAAYYAAAPTKTTYRRPTKHVKMVKDVPGHKKIIYPVKRGDTLGDIAEIYNTRASNIRSWNGLRYGEYIRPNQKLNIWVPENLDELKERVTSSSSAKIESNGQYYTVRFGDTLWDISKKYGVSIKEIKELNKLRTSQIRPGDRLLISKN